MEPITWVLVLGACAVVGVFVSTSRNKATSTLARNTVRQLADKVLPPDAERGTDRITDEVCRAVGAQVRRGARPRTVKVRVGPQLFDTVVPGGDVGPVTLAIRGELGDMDTPITGNDLSITVTREPALDPTAVAVAVSGRGASPTPQPRTVTSPAEPAVPLRRSRTTIVLKPLRSDLPTLEVVTPDTELTIGRENCDLKLPERTGAAYGTGRVHAVVQGDFGAGCLHVRDNDSLHKTFLNGDPITTATARHLDTLALGTAEWLVLVEEA